MPFDHRQFRDVMGSFATGVAVATARDAAGRPAGVTVSSFTSVSLDPPLILFCLEWVAETWPAFRDGTHFAVNILAEGQAATSSRFASVRLDRWAGVEYREGLHGCPLLTDSVGWVVCRKETVHEGGDHAIIVGRVEALESDPTRAPLLHFRGAYGRFDRAG
ncbi:3-hydroxy-9,10-secoandrosta-1,3,5(10)-triene-9,17-dione monooxygenase reductase component [Stella humosa]|uniref:3-hydroxy-9,10-secoandrosta-1,3,5(10)-triene-9, 17-dione monooxygenase reductase component n=1 Tax=Stella humosa TaxID=94 RepID=A0A3N1KK67_9PROT|nr:flavin reductase family protein [Stella humosa]ROP81221.1 3-hydroxy-9,10-secoandrosta-1,3,5(10)-triene-9,17-dione monooxygenase reductase component [Stella humosa]BBK32568.1 nitrilotriacetate monooxygenase [Stella humosa]